MGRFSFSGHESFFCKPLWLKKGYDALASGVDLSSPDAVVHLGVGKNMVSSIKFWMRAFGLSVDKEPTELAKALFDTESGWDPFLEDTGTLWLLHYYLVKNGIASIYNLSFLGLQREKREFDRQQLQSFIKRKCSVPQQSNTYNENTVRKDIGVFLHNYVSPSDTKSLEDYSAIFLDLGLIKCTGTAGVYAFSEIPPSDIHPLILLHALLDYKGDDNTISLDLMQDLSLIFCLGIPGFIEIVKELVSAFPDNLAYTDNSGIKNIHFMGHLDSMQILNQYYKHDEI